MLPLTLVRLLLLQGPDPAHLSAASGLVRVGPWLYVVADDELGLGCFDLRRHEPGLLRRLSAPEVQPLPVDAAGRKAHKPDTEALVRLPALPGAPHGALLALGSGSRKNRQQGACWALERDGTLAGLPRSVDLAPLYAPLHRHFGELNLEGAFVQGDALVLLQRGHRDAPLSASVRFGGPALWAWLGREGDAPSPERIDEYALGALDGVPLGFTDGVALPDGGWLFTAAAEDTGDAYLDGACAGSAVGRVDATGQLVGCLRLQPRCKVEGLALAADGDGRSLLMVTDADDRAQPARLMATRLPDGF